MNLRFIRLPLPCENDNARDPISLIPKIERSKLFKNLLKVVFLIFALELIAMGALGLLPEIPYLYEAIIDATALTLLATPFLWRFYACSLSKERIRRHMLLKTWVDGFIVSDLNGRIKEVNTAFCRATGYSKEELLETYLEAIEIGAGSKNAPETRLDAIPIGNSKSFFKYFQKKDGSILETQVFATRFSEPDDYISFFIRDLQEQRKAEEALRSIASFQKTLAEISIRFAHATSKNIAKSIEETLHTLGSFFNADRTVFLQFNPNLSGFEECREWNAQGRQSQTMTICHLPRQFIEILANRLQTEGIVQLSNRETISSLGIEIDSEKPAFQSLLCLPLSQKEKLKGCIGFLYRNRRAWKSDETGLLRVVSTIIAGALNRIQIEAALHKSETHLSFLLKASPVTIYTCSPTPPFSTTYVSPSIRQLTGYDQENFIDDRHFWADNIHPQDRQRVLQHFESLETGAKSQIEYRLLNTEGSYSWMHDEHRLIRDNHGNPSEIIGYWAVITERKIAEEYLKKEKNKLEHEVKQRAAKILAQAKTQRLQAAALTAASNAIFITDRTASIAWANPAFCNLSGYSMEEVMGRNPRFLKSGKNAPEHYQTLWNTILSGEVWNSETTNRRKDGTCYTVEQTITPVLAENNEISHFISINQDLTKQKRLELQFLQAQKMESVERLHGSVANDWKTAPANATKHGDRLHIRIHE